MKFDAGFLENLESDYKRFIENNVNQIRLSYAGVYDQEEIMFLVGDIAQKFYLGGGIPYPKHSDQYENHYELWVWDPTSEGPPSNALDGWFEAIKEEKNVSEWGLVNDIRDLVQDGTLEAQFR